MKYILIAIVDSENSSLPVQVDIKRRAYYDAFARFDAENKNRSIEEIVDAFHNPAEEVSAYSRLVGLFEGKLRLPLKKYQETEFESYDIDEVLSVRELLSGYESGDWELFPQAMLLPDTSLAKEDWSANRKENEKLEKEWEEKVTSLLKQYQERGVAVIVRCDS